MATTEKFSTRIDLAPKVRERSIDLCNRGLADIMDLYSQTKHAHWNVKGPQFHQLHELYDKLAATLAGFADLVAERATQLGGLAMGTVRMAARTSRLPEYPADALDGLATVEALAARFADTASTVRSAIDESAEAGDMTTSDLFTEVSRGLDKALWFLEAHLQS